MIANILFFIIHLIIWLLNYYCKNFIFSQSAQSSALLCQFFVCTKVNFEPIFTTGCRDAPAVGSRFSKVKNNDMTDRTESRQNMQYLAPYYQLNQNIDWQRV